jgi:hypothetical protein
VLVMGCAGAGKSRFARELATRAQADEFLARAEAA